MASETPVRPSDDELISAAAAGSKSAFTALVRRYEETVFSFAYKVCRDRQKAGETMQDTFINVYRKLDSFDRKSKFSTWLYAIVSNSCLMRNRRRKLDEVMESLDEPPAPHRPGHEVRQPRWDETPADLLMNRELRQLLERAIDRLPVDYRVVFVLRDIEDRSTDEAARLLTISQDAVKSRLRRARAFLRHQLDPYMAENAE